MIHQPVGRSISKTKSLHEGGLDSALLDDFPGRSRFLRRKHLLEVRCSAVMDFKKLLALVRFFIAISGFNGIGNPEFLATSSTGSGKGAFSASHKKTKRIEREKS